MLDKFFKNPKITTKLWMLFVILFLIIGGILHICYSNDPKYGDALILVPIWGGLLFVVDSITLMIFLFIWETFELPGYIFFNNIINRFLKW